MNVLNLQGDEVGVEIISVRKRAGFTATHFRLLAQIQE